LVEHDPCKPAAVLGPVTEIICVVKHKAHRLCSQIRDVEYRRVAVTRFVSKTGSAVIKLGPRVGDKWRQATQ
jgi:hypothetical protein